MQEKEKCSVKLKELQKYVPFLKRLLEKMRNEAEVDHQPAVYTKIMFLFKFLTTDETEKTYSLVLKCEQTLIKIRRMFLEKDNTKLLNIHKNEDVVMGTSQDSDVEFSNDIVPRPIRDSVNNSPNMNRNKSIVIELSDSSDNDNEENRINSASPNCPTSQKNDPKLPEINNSQANISIVLDDNQSCEEGTVDSDNAITDQTDNIGDGLENLTNDTVTKNQQEDISNECSEIVENDEVIENLLIKLEHAMNGNTEAQLKLALRVLGKELNKSTFEKIKAIINFEQKTLEIAQSSNQLCTENTIDNLQDDTTSKTSDGIAGSVKNSNNASPDKQSKGEENCNDNIEKRELGRIHNKTVKPKTNCLTELKMLHRDIRETFLFKNFSTKNQKDHILLKRKRKSFENATKKLHSSHMHDHKTRFMVTKNTRKTIHDQKENKICNKELQSLVVNEKPRKRKFTEVKSDKTKTEGNNVDLKKYKSDTTIEQNNTPTSVVCSEETEEPAVINENATSNRDNPKKDVPSQTSDVLSKNDDEETSIPKTQTENSLLEPLKAVPFYENTSNYNSAPDISSSGVKKNTNPMFHWQSVYVERCQICFEKLKHITHHYRVVHPDSEVLISRIRQIELDYLLSSKHCPYRSNKMFAFECVFCQKLSNKSLRDWFEHYITHTGEYPYKCSVCGIIRASLRKFKHKLCSGTADSAIRCSGVTPDIDSIYLYICKFCNYSQLNKSNIVKHLHTQHDIEDISHTFYHSILLLTVNKKVFEDFQTLNMDFVKSSSQTKQCKKMLPNIVTSSGEQNVVLEKETVKKTTNKKPQGLRVKSLTKKQKLLLKKSTQIVENQQEKLTRIGTQESSSHSKSTSIDCNSFDYNNLLYEESFDENRSSREQGIDQNLFIDETEQKPMVELLDYQNYPNRNQYAERNVSITPRYSGEYDFPTPDAESKSKENNQIEETQFGMENAGSELISNIKVEREKMLSPDKPWNVDIQFNNELEEEEIFLGVIDLDSYEAETPQEVTIKNELINNQEISIEESCTTENNGQSDFDKAAITKENNNSNYTEPINNTINSLNTKSDIVTIESSNRPTECAQIKEIFKSLHGVFFKNLNSKVNDEESVKRISNIGYQFTDRQIRYHCLIETCTFSSMGDLNGIRQHLENLHPRIPLQKYCSSCNFQFDCQDPSQSLECELNHIFWYHTEIRDKLTCNTFSSAISSQMAIFEECSSSLDKYEDDLFEEINSLVEAKDMSKNILKPWINSTLCKKSIKTCNLMLEENMLRMLYKCMGDDCFFATESSKEMRSHLTNCHEENFLVKQSVEKRSWLECSYCAEYFKSCNNLLNHISKEHRNSLYQCSNCFYRSCSEYMVYLHQRSIHSKASNKHVLHCVGEPYMIATELKAVIESLQTNVKPFACKMCDKQFYVMKSLINHITNEHKQPTHYVDNMNFYACVYCVHEDQKLFQIIKHLFSEHPNKLPYIYAKDTICKLGQNETTLPGCLSCGILLYFGKCINDKFIKSPHLVGVNVGEIICKQIYALDSSETVPLTDLQVIKKEIINLSNDNNCKIKLKPNASINRVLPKFVPKSILYKCFYFDKCSFIGNTCNELDIHLKVNHKSEKVHKCLYCPVRLSSQIENHLRFHGEKIYTCTMCDVVSTNLRKLMRHIQQKHQIEEFQVTKHIRNEKTVDTTHGTYLFKNLKLSGTGSTSVATSTSEFSEIINEQIDDIKPEKVVYSLNFCRKCSYQSASSEDMKLHIKSHLTNTKNLPNSNNSIDKVKIQRKKPNNQIKVKSELIDEGLSGIYARDVDSKLNVIKKSNAILQMQQNQSHLKAVSQESVIFICICNMEFKNMNELNMHWSTVHVKRPFQYRVCKKYQCVYCRYSSSLKALKIHHNTKHSMSPFAYTEIGSGNICGECGLNFPIVEAIIAHSQVMHKTLLKKKDSAEFLNDKLIEQLSTKGNSSVSYKCSVCNCIFKKPKVLSNHAKTIHNMSRKNDKEIESYKETNILYGCIQCQQYYLEERDLIKHIFDHVEKYKCRHCGLLFVSYDAIHDHIRMAHKTNNYYYSIEVKDDVERIAKFCNILFPKGLLLLKSEVHNTSYGQVSDLYAVKKLILDEYAEASQTLGKRKTTK